MTFVQNGIQLKRCTIMTKKNDIEFKISLKSDMKIATKFQSICVSIKCIYYKRHFIWEKGV